MKNLRNPWFVIGFLIPVLIGVYIMYILSPNKLRVDSICKTKTINVDFEDKIKSNYISGMSLFIDDSLAMEYHISKEIHDKNRLFGHVTIFDRNDPDLLEHVYSINTDNQDVIFLVRTDTINQTQ